MRSRIPLILAGLLIIALMATIGLAAFTPGGSDTTAEDSAFETLDVDYPISGRVASAVLALAVAPVRGADLATSTTLAVAESSTSTTADESDTTPTTEESALIAPSSSTTAADTTTTTTEDATVPTVAADTTPPALQVLSPKDGATVTSRVIEFTGVTERGAEVFSGPFEAETDAQGDWAINLVLAPGANGASFTARDAAGNESSVRIVVNYDAPDSTTTTTTKAEPTTSETPSGTTTTTKAPSTTTTEAPSSGYSPQWPADPGGRQNVENWRSTVAKYWPADRVDCVLGIIYRESGGDPTARNSSSNALGLMQHLGKYWPSRAAGAGFVDSNGLIASPYNGAANIAAGKWVADWAEQNQGAWWKPWSSLPSYGSCGS
ncbi:MAG: hypothetical protein WBO21_03855 [Acidimicrobiia bacterium]